MVNQVEVSFILLLLAALLSRFPHLPLAQDPYGDPVPYGFPQQPFFPTPVQPFPLRNAPSPSPTEPPQSPPRAPTEPPQSPPPQYGYPPPAPSPSPTEPPQSPPRAPTEPPQFPPPQDGYPPPGNETGSKNKKNTPLWVWVLIGIFVPFCLIGIAVVACMCREKRATEARDRAEAGACPNLENPISGTATVFLGPTSLSSSYTKSSSTGNFKIVAGEENKSQEAPATMPTKASIVRSSASNFSYAEVKRITNNFEKVIGRGGSSTVYYGCLNNNSAVAVKMVQDSSSEIQLFNAEIEILLNINHRNLVSLVGFCEEGNNVILVSEYMSNGDLWELLSGPKNIEGALTWKRRLQIALGAAKGLEYLHTGCKPMVIHGDIKTRNILLDGNLEAKLADFGLSKTRAVDGSTYYKASKVTGTPGYIDPEYYNTQILNRRSDVYSFGVVLFELITGKPAIFNIGNDYYNLVQWVRPRIFKGGIESIVDPRLQGCYRDINSIWKVVKIAKKATEQSPNARPDVTVIVNALNEAMKMENFQGNPFQQFVRSFNIRKF